MKIGIDGACWWNERGFGRFTRELLRALIARPRGHEFTVFFDRDPPPELNANRYAAVRVPTHRQVTEAAVASGRRGLLDIAAFTRAVLAHPVDTFLFPAVYSWFPLPPGRKSVTVVHDAIAEQFPDLVFPRRRARLYWAAKVRLALWQSTRVLTVSESAKRDIVRYLRVAPDRIDVTSEAADAAFRPVVDADAIQRARAAVGVPAGARFVLYVGGVAPHKNVIGLVRGFRRALAQGDLPDLYLVIAGDPAGAGFLSCTNDLIRVIDGDPTLRARVRVPGYVPDTALPALYTAALAVAMPAFAEGFGLPAIEAMACGTPVLSSAVSAVPELIGDAGLLFDPAAPDSIAGAIVEIATAPAIRASLHDRALARAADFTWERAADLALQSLERAQGMA